MTMVDRGDRDLKDAGRIQSSINWKWVVGAAAIAALSIWSYLRPNSYEECMVAEMRGQPQGMHYVVDKVCSRRFNREVDIGKQVKFEWDEYVVTRA